MFNGKMKEIVESEEKNSYSKLMFVTATQGRRRKERKNKTSQGYAFTNIIQTSLI